jgi:5-methylthioadenosine/S-adenosylhomocysteine deaminase
MSEVVLIDALVVTMNEARDVIASGYVWIRGRHIHAVGAMADLDAPDDVERRSVRGFAVLPGLINTHTHISSFGLRGMQDQGPQNYPGVKMYDGLRALDGEGGYLGSAVALLEQIQGGITTVVAGEAGSDDCLAGAVRASCESGARVILSRASMDSSVSVAANLVIPEDLREDTSDALARLDWLRGTVTSELVTVVPEAFSVMRVSREMMLALHGYATEHGLPLLMHAGATQNERVECLERTGLRIVHYLDDLGVLGDGVLLGHGTWFDDEESALVAERGASIAHCAVANAWSGNRFSPLKEWLEMGVRVGIGTDGATSNNGQDIFEAAKFAIYGQKIRLSDMSWGTPELALELLTIKGAEAVGMADQIGSLEADKLADLICIDLQRPSMAPLTSVLSNLVYAHDRSAVRHVMVDGQFVFEDGEHRTFDGSSLVEDLNAWAEPALAASGLLDHFRSVSPFTFV